MRERLLEFIEQLRQSGIRISIAESIDACNAAAAAGLDRIRFREALAASLIKDEGDRETFDRLFLTFFHLRTDGKRTEDQNASDARLNLRSGQQPTGTSPIRKEDQEAKREQRESEQPTEEETTGDEDIAADEDLGDEEARELEAREHGRIKRKRELERKPFAEFNELDFDEVFDVLEPLRRRFRVRLGRRLRRARRGRLDFRRTIRASMQRGGTLIDLNFRARRPRHFDLLILADISGSVRYSSELLLGIAAGAIDLFRRVDSFVFIDRLAEASFEQGHLVMSPALDLYARSDFGKVLHELRGKKRELINRATVLVIMGDGRNNRRPPRGDLLRHIARQCRAVLWLNPEPRRRWNTGDSAIAVYEREVTALLECENLKHLETALTRVG